MKSKIVVVDWRMRNGGDVLVVRRSGGQARTYRRVTPESLTRLRRVIAGLIAGRQWYWEGKQAWQHTMPWWTARDLYPPRRKVSDVEWGRMQKARGIKVMHSFVEGRDVPIDEWIASKEAGEVAR